jgi:hypothetical protein
MAATPVRPDDILNQSIGNEISGRATRVPPWMIFWLVSNAVSFVPAYYHEWAQEALFLVGLTDALPGIPTSEPLSGRELMLYRLVTIVDLFPPMVMLTAVITIAAVPVRRWMICRRNGTTSRTPSEHEIKQYLQQIAPEVESRFSTEGRKKAQTYARGLRRYGVIICRDLESLWQRDRAAAQFVIRHEVAHCRRGDPLLLGALSPLEYSLRGLPWIVVAFGIVPQLLEWILQTFHDDLFRADIHFLTSQFFTIVLPGLIAMFFIGVAQVMAVMTMPIAATWSAELASDHDAAGEHIGDYSRAVESYAGTPPRKGARWLRRMNGIVITHPPRSLRRFFDNASSSTQRMTAILIYPAGWLVQLGWLILLVFTTRATNLINSDPSRLGAELKEILRKQLSDIAAWASASEHLVLWLAAAIFIALWARWGPRFMHRVIAQ